jgi:hypothetical protein
MSENKKISRRRFLKFAGVAGGVALAGCAAPSAAPCAFGACGCTYHGPGGSGCRCTYCGPGRRRRRGDV